VSIPIYALKLLIHMHNQISDLNSSKSMRLIFGIAFILCTHTGTAQGVKLSETPGDPDQSAILDIESSSKGMLPPRMSTAQRDQINNPAEGLLIFNTDTKCLNMWMGTSWKKSCFDCDYLSPVPQSNSPVCEGANLQLTAGNLPGAIYLWVGPNGFSSSDQNPVIPAISIAAAGNYMLTVSYEGCTAQPLSAVVSVTTNPASPEGFSNSPVCLGETLDLGVIPVDGALYNWSGPEGFQASGVSTDLTDFQEANVGTYHVTATVNGCVSAPAALQVSAITVPEQPSVIVGPDAVCPNEAGVGFEVTSEDITSYQWTFPQGWEVLTGQGTASVTATSGLNGGEITVTPSNSCGNGPERSLPISMFELASGGIITDIPGYRVHTFNSSGTFSVECDLTGLEVLVVAGGGGGGMGWEGGGGGAGGVLHSSNYSVSPGQEISVVVGAGGIGGNGGASIDATNGNNSSFGTLTAVGGGAGGSLYGATGASGGSGGGAPWGKTPGSGTSGQGHAGGGSTAGQYVGAGGGGGAGGPGQNLTGPSAGAQGGIGQEFTITGTPTYFGGGGGGSAYQSYNPPGGLGGGGNGSCETPTATTPTSGQANTGGGGGASRVTSINGGDGGSGVVIVRYPID